MARSNRTLIVVVGIGAALGLAAGLFYLLVLGPRQAERAAQDEVEAWGQAWADARACLVGPEPALRDGAAAYLLREATGAPPEELTACEDLLYALKRDADFGSGDSALEGAWLDTQEPIRKLAMALSWRNAADKPRPLSELIDALAEAVAGMDAANDSLRQAAGLEPQAWPGAELPPLATTPLVEGEVEWVLVGEGGFAARLGGDAPRLVVRGASGDTELPLSSWVEPSRAGGWGMWRERDGEILSREARFGEAPAALRVGPLDAQGDPADTGTLLEAPGAAAAFPVFAAGDGEQRAVLYRVIGSDGTMALRARQSSDGGATWSSAIEADSDDGAQVHIDEVGRRADVVWLEDGSVRWLPIAAGAPKAPQIVSRTASYASLPTCTAGRAAWWVQDGQIFFAAGDDQPARVVPAPFSGGLLRARCTDERFTALVLEQEDYAVRSCTAAGCEAGARTRLRPLSSVHAASADGGLAVATSVGDLLLVWRPGTEGFAPVAQLGAGDVLEGLYSRDGALVAVISGEAGYRRARL